MVWDRPDPSDGTTCASLWNLVISKCRETKNIPACRCRPGSREYPPIQIDTGQGRVVPCPYPMSRSRATHYVWEVQVPLLKTVGRNGPSYMRNRQVLFFVDNTVCLSACVHGYARSPHMAALANALHLALVQLKCHAWWEYVPSQANGADFPSRPHSVEVSEFYDKEGFQVWSSPLRLPSFDNLRYPLLEDVDN